VYTSKYPSIDVTPIPTLSSLFCSTPALALLDTAINPDTGKIADYKELSQSSEEPLWQASNAEEIGQLTQGFGDQIWMNTMFLIPYKSIPRNKKPTYLQVVSAFQPEKANPRCIR
jgi:hypothetical protein